MLWEVLAVVDGKDKKGGKGEKGSEWVGKRTGLVASCFQFPYQLCPRGGDLD